MKKLNRHLLGVKYYMIICMAVLVMLLNYTAAVKSDSSNFKYGDVDGNGLVQLDDAVLTLKSALGITDFDENQKRAADVDGKNGVTLDDTLLVLKCALGIIQSFPVEANSNVTDKPTNKNNMFVAYFSATGTTRKVAENISEVIGADLYEIKAKQPYTSADLNYNDSDSRVSIEHNNDSARPEIEGSIENIQQYDIIFLGYAGGIIGLN